MSVRTARGYSVLGLVAGMALLLILFGVMFSLLNRDSDEITSKRPGGPETPLARDLEQGREVACRNNLSQIRLAIRMEMENDIDNAAPPASLLSLGNYGITSTMLQCPVTKLDYRYDPRTGLATCPTPGHENY